MSTGVEAEDHGQRPDDLNLCLCGENWPCPPLPVSTDVEREIDVAEIRACAQDFLNPHDRDVFFAVCDALVEARAQRDEFAERLRAGIVLKYAHLATARNERAERAEAEVARIKAHNGECGTCDGYHGCCDALDGLANAANEQMRELEARRDDAYHRAEKAENQARHWQEQEAKQRRLRAEEGRWKHRALAAEGNIAGHDARALKAEVRLASIRVLLDTSGASPAEIVAGLRGFLRLTDQEVPDEDGR